MEHIDKYILKFYIALFGSVILHSFLFLLLFIVFPNFIPEKKTIPFQLISNERLGNHSNSSQLSKSENALAAQEFLRTLNESTFEQLIRTNTKKSNTNSEKPSPFKPTPQSDTASLNQGQFLQNKNNPNVFEGLQNIFSRKPIQQEKSSSTQQLTTKALEELSEYEIQLLQRMAKNELYDKFHPVMKKHEQDRINYVITLHLFPNGAIKSAKIKNSSNIDEIDNLAINAAYLASPFPKPPSEDIKKSFLYEIPIVYDKKQRQ